MKTYTIFKDWYLMTNEEQEAFRKDALESYLDNTNEDIEDYDKEAFEDYCINCNNDYFYDDFGIKYSNLSCSPLNNQKVVVKGILGLWNGTRQVGKTFDNVAEAVRACLEEYNHIYEDQYGNLCIEAHHHDGTNHFVIKKVTDKGLRCLHFRREVFGA